MSDGGRWNRPTECPVPGIALTDGPAGYRATIIGTGLDVWEVISTWRSVNESWEALQSSYAWLTDAQLQSAIEYYRLDPTELDARIAVEEHWTPERVRNELPFLALRREP